MDQFTHWRLTVPLLLVLYFEECLFYSPFTLLSKQKKYIVSLFQSKRSLAQMAQMAHIFCNLTPASITYMENCY